MKPAQLYLSTLYIVRSPLKRRKRIEYIADKLHVHNAQFIGKNIKQQEKETIVYLIYEYKHKSSSKMSVFQTIFHQNCCTFSLLTDQGSYIMFSMGR